MRLLIVCPVDPVFQLYDKLPVPPPAVTDILPLETPQAAEDITRLVAITGG